MDYLSIISSINKDNKISESCNAIVYKKGKYIIKMIALDKAHTNEIKALKKLTKIKSSKYFISRYRKSIKTNINIYIVMETLTGPDLFDMAGCYQKIEEYIIIMRHLLHGLEFMHNNGIVHRDIKLENIVLDKKCPKYVDFGHSILLDDMKHNFRTGGTIKCLSPELLELYNHSVLDFSQLNEIKKILIASDIWALGISFYELINNRMAFCDRNIMVLKNDVKERDIFSYTNTFLDQVVEDMLTKDYHLRPNISEILTQLDRNL